MTTLLAIELIRTNGGTQMRAALNEDAIVRYAESAAELPPLVVFNDGEDYWLADGFQRLEAHKRAGAKTVKCDVRAGTIRDALLFAVGANAEHDSAGVARTNADKRRAVGTMLRDEEWSQWSNRAIAQQTGVSRQLVNDMRAELAQKPDVASDATSGPTAKRKKARDGKSYPAKPGAEPPTPGAARDAASRKRRAAAAEPAGDTGPAAPNKRQVARAVKHLADLRGYLLEISTVAARLIDYADPHMSCVPQQDVSDTVAAANAAIKTIDGWRRRFK